MDEKDGGNFYIVNEFSKFRILLSKFSERKFPYFIFSF